MKRLKIQLTPEAENDIDEARKWYRKQSPELPKRFSKCLKETLDKLRSLPSTHSIRYNEVRLANIPIFPYAIHYLMEEETIIILAVHHTAIDPAKWKDRI